MQCKKIATSFLILTSLYTVSSLANAKDAIFENQSKYNLTLNINENTTQPTVLLPSGTKKMIDERSFKQACGNQSDQCIVTVSKPNTVKPFCTLIYKGMTVAAYSFDKDTDVWTTSRGGKVLFEDK